MGERLAGGNVAVALLANTLATGAVLVALILTFGPLSGAHFNPAVTLAVAWERGLAWSDVPAYLGGAGRRRIRRRRRWRTLMFDLPLFSLSEHARHGPAQLLSEFVATFGLLARDPGLRVASGRRRSRSRSGHTSRPPTGSRRSTAFANPAVTLARAASDTFAGIRPADVPGFVIAQLCGAVVATILIRWLIPSAEAAPGMAASAAPVPLQRNG